MLTLSEHASIVGPMGAIHAIDSDADAAGRGSDYVATSPRLWFWSPGLSRLQNNLTLPMIRDGL